MKITLIRHTSVDVPKGTCYGQTDVPLRDTFTEEAAITAGNINHETFDKVFVSPLSRCVRLADYCGYSDAIRDNRIMELNFGEWEMQHFEHITDPVIQEWFANFLHVPPTGGESFMMQFERVSRFLDELQGSNYDHVAAFTHGGVILCAQVYAGLIKFEEAFDRVTPYGGIVELQFPAK